MRERRLSSSTLPSRVSGAPHPIRTWLRSNETPIQTVRMYRVFSHDVTAAILVSQNNETAAMLVSQTNPVGVELFSYANAFFCSDKFA